MIKNIIFDMGNVLIPFDRQVFLKAAADSEEDRQFLNREVFQSLEWLQTDSGDLTVPQAVAVLQERLPARFHGAIAGLFYDWIDLTEPWSGMERLVTELKEQGYGVYLLSNVSGYFHEFKHKIPAVSHMDGLFISADYRMLKPYPEIYKKFLSVFSLEPAECLFIDDLPINIYGAARAGIEGIVFHGEESLRRDLRRYDVQPAFLRRT